MAFNYFISYVSYYTLVALAGGIGLIFPSAVTKTFGLGGGLGFSLGLSPFLECPFIGLLFVSTGWSFISLDGSSISAGPENHSQLVINMLGLDLQGDPNQNLVFQMAVALKLCISDHMLVKPKLVWEAVVFCVKNYIFEKK